MKLSEYIARRGCKYPKCRQARFREAVAYCSRHLPLLVDCPRPKCQMLKGQLCVNPNGSTNHGGHAARLKLALREINL